MTMNDETYSLPVVSDTLNKEMKRQLDEESGDVFKLNELDVVHHDHKLNVVTNSLRNTFLDCSQKYYFEYIRRLTPNVTPDYFVWGGFLHFAVEHASAGVEMDVIQEKLRSLIENVASLRGLSSWLVNQYEGFVLLIPHVLDAYLLHYKDEYDLYEVIVAETKFSMPLGNESGEGIGWRFEGKIDRLVRNTKTHAIYVWDLKTPAATGDMFWNRLPLDSQMKGYVLATQRSLGIHTTFAMYDVIQKPSQQKKKCEDPEDWAEMVGTQYLVQHDKLFQRKVIEYPQWTIDHYQNELSMVAKQIAFHQREALWIQHHPGNRIGGCPYFNLCVHNEKPLHMADFYEREAKNFNNELSEE